MNIFISHSDKDKDLALALSELISGVDLSINVFCTSENRSILIGENYVEKITSELNTGDFFIPLLSESYFKSKFCVIELGFAYAILYNRNSNGSYHIYPLSIPPLKKEDAFVNTPLSQLQVGMINIADHIKTLCIKKLNIRPNNELNKNILDFVSSVNNIIFDSYDINKGAKILLCKSSNVSGTDTDYLAYSSNIGDGGYTINFRAKPFDTSNVAPDFLSFVFKYVDKIDLHQIVDLFEDAQLVVPFNNYTNSLQTISIEIKCSDNNQVLDRRTVQLGAGKNSIYIPLGELDCNSLKSISEICFVLTPSSYLEDEGMFQISQFAIIHS